MSALPVPSPRSPEVEPQPGRGGKKPPARSRQSNHTEETAAVKAPKNRPHAGKRFVGLETWFLRAVRLGANSQAEMALILFVAEMADSREMGNPFGRTPYLLNKDLAADLGCTTQNVNCSAAAWFGPEGLVHRYEHPRS
jgi:hypothetical protein